MESVKAFLRPIARKLIYTLVLAACIAFMGLTKDITFFEGTSFATEGNALGLALLFFSVVMFLTAGKNISNPISMNDNKPIETSEK